ncbi:hypothetical protein EYF80_009248 [Liparis tanakae]|uniref:Uncharacterized protein n=1 Tax=Liparis tanakae TaxID=230148 RepID=A0A4Z2IR95_9TELE|nr:hypothetical protein EYF80_009248 [Liparis tanakae]
MNENECRVIEKSNSGGLTLSEERGRKPEEKKGTSCMRRGPAWRRVTSTHTIDIRPAILRTSTQKLSVNGPLAEAVGALMFLFLHTQQALLPEPLHPFHVVLEGCGSPIVQKNNSDSKASNSTMQHFQRPLQTGQSSGRPTLTLTLCGRGT